LPGYAASWAALAGSSGSTITWARCSPSIPLAWRSSLAELRWRELLFLYSRTTSDSVAARTAERMHVPFTERDVFIDNELDLQ
jgi:hypothetical protein